MWGLRWVAALSLPFAHMLILSRLCVAPLPIFQETRTEDAFLIKCRRLFQLCSTSARLDWVAGDGLVAFVRALCPSATQEAVDLMCRQLSPDASPVLWPAAAKWLAAQFPAHTPLQRDGPVIVSLLCFCMSQRFCVRRPFPLARSVCSCCRSFPTLPWVATASCLR